MDMQVLFNALSDYEKTQLDDLIYSWKKDNAEKYAKDIILNDLEIAHIQNGFRIEAIKSIKDRYDCTLMVAKIAVDNYVKQQLNIARQIHNMDG